MKKAIAIMTVTVMAGSLSASAVLIAGWETWSNTGTAAASQVNGATGSATDTVWSLFQTAASTDGTFGTLVSPAADATTDLVNDGFALVNGADGYIDFTITAGAAAIELETFHMDMTRFRFGSAENWTLDIVAGDLSNTNVSSGSMGVYNADQNLPDFDLDLTGLADSQLDALGSVTFRLSLTGGNGALGQHTYVDNVALSGTVIPEPATMGLIVSFSGGLLFIRRRFMM